MSIKIGAERHKVPYKEWRQALLEQGGSFNGAPRYRLCWGYDDHERYSVPERWLERWHLEWFHPVSASYERIATFEEGITKEFMSPTIALLLEAVSAHQKTVGRKAKEIRAKIEAEVAAQERATAARKVDLMEEAETAFPFKTWMPVSGPMTAERRRRSEYGG